MSQLELSDVRQVEVFFTVILSAVQSSSTIFIIGNGGSLSIAQHAICDFMKGASGIKGQVRCVDLSSPSILSAYGNDLGYSEVFSQQIKLLGKANDLLIIVSSSGNSENILGAAIQAKSLGLRTFALVGFDNPSVIKYVDDFIWVKNSNYGIVEDIHMSILHSVSQRLRIELN